MFAFRKLIIFPNLAHFFDHPVNLKREENTEEKVRKKKEKINKMKFCIPQ